MTFLNVGIVIYPDISPGIGLIFFDEIPGFEM